MGEMYSFSVAKAELDAANATIARYAAIVLEIRIISAIEDPKISLHMKKAKLGELTNKVGEYSTKYGLDLQTVMAPMVIAEGLGKLLNRAP